MVEATNPRNAIWYIESVMHTLLNKSNARKFALHTASNLRPCVGFRRVSEEFLVRIEGKLRWIITQEVKALPSKGVTIK